MAVTDELKKLGNAYSVLALSSIETLQDNINEIIKGFSNEGVSGVYVTFNKPYNGIKRILKSEKINTDKILFIDCITSAVNTKNDESLLYINNPSDLEALSDAITEFTSQIEGPKFLIIDALATLLIYNTEELVIKFVKKLNEESKKTGLRTVVLSQNTKSGELIDRIALFFDKMINLG